MIDVEDRRLGGIDAVMSSSKRVRAGRLANPSGREVMALLEISLHVLSRFNGGTNKRIESLKASTGPSNRRHRSPATWRDSTGSSASNLIFSAELDFDAAA